MDESERWDHLSKLLNVRMAIVEVGIAETNEEAWLCHLSTHPKDHHANVRIFNRQKPGAEPERPRY
jgi:hypothetical protein